MDAATLAAVLLLPDADQATEAVHTWLGKNGFVPDEQVLTFQDRDPSLSGVAVVYSDELYSDDIDDTVRVCIWRQSPSVFAGFSGIKAVYVSATAAARFGPASGSRVLP